MTHAGTTSSSIHLCSWPDFRLLVRSTGDDNHETTLVIPELLVPSVRYARLIVDEGSAFAEHAVVLLDSATPDPTGVIVRALSVARPTRVSFLRLGDGLVRAGPSIAGGEVTRAQVAASACACLIESAGPALQQDAPEELERQIRFEEGAFTGVARIRRVAQMFEVSIAD